MVQVRQAAEPNGNPDPGPVSWHRRRPRYAAGTPRRPLWEEYRKGLHEDWEALNHAFDHWARNVDDSYHRK